jgi:hypothetical protein
MWRYRFGNGKHKGGVTRVEAHNLQPGELVQDRSEAEIMATLDARGHNRCLSFNDEMAVYCGRTFRVLRRVGRIIDESTGKMLRPRKDCIVLEDVVCGRQRNIRRLGAPEAFIPIGARHGCDASSPAKA